MDLDEPISKEAARRAIEAVRSHPRRQKLGQLAFDVLSRQAEGRTLYGGRDFVRGRAEAHRIERADADTPFGNLLDLFEKGPGSVGERALVAAFAVFGLGERAAEPEGREILERFLRHADWLETASPYGVYSFLDLLPSDIRRLLASMLGAGLRSEQRIDAAARARAVVRLTGLRSIPEGVEELGRTADEAHDGWIRAMARSMGEEGARHPSDRAPSKVEGMIGRVPRASLRDVARLVTGIAALGWALRAILSAFGVRREGTLELVPSGLKLRSRIRMFGQSVREREEVVSLRSIATVGRRVRYPALPLLVGAVALGSGVLFGGLLLAEGTRTGQTTLLLVGAGTILGGAALDLLLSVLAPAWKGKVAVEVRLVPKRAFRLHGVPQGDADRFLDAVERKMSESCPGDG